MLSTSKLDSMQVGLKKRAEIGVHHDKFVLHHGMAEAIERRTELLGDPRVYGLVIATVTTEAIGLPQQNRQELIVGDRLHLRRDDLARRKEGIVAGNARLFGLYRRRKPVVLAHEDGLQCG